MKKDVIYVDIEDDITSIIEKVKGASSNIVALVPPKRVGILQSVVNLKLLEKAAKQGGKRVVLITNDRALTALAGGVGVPVAKNLQSKPVVPATVADTDDESDVIEGEEIVPAAVDTADDSVDAITAEETTTENPKRKAVGAAALAPKKGPRIPDFDAMRNKIFIISGLAVLLISFLVWAIFFAPRATIAITAKTNVVNISKNLQLLNDSKVDPVQNILPPVVKQIKKSASVDFTATGKKEVGEKATGTVKFSRQGLSSVTVAAGTQLVSASGLAYTTDKTVTIPASSFTGSGCFPTACPGTASVDITAVVPGSQYNGATGSMTGTTSDISVTITSATTGGTDKTATVVSTDDITKATEQLKAQDANEVKTELKKLFTGDVLVIDESFLVEPGTPTSVPALDQEATTAKLSTETTYTLVGLKTDDLKQIYEAYLKTQLKSDGSQKIYDIGERTTHFTQVQKIDSGFTVTIAATGQIGPNIEAATIAEQAKGRRAGEIQQSIEAVQGVERAEVKLSPFWVMNAPNDTKKITVTFVLNKQ